MYLLAWTRESTSGLVMAFSYCFIQKSTVVLFYPILFLLSPTILIYHSYTITSSSLSKNLNLISPQPLPPQMSLVERCYSFHGCDYLLQFCASLVAQMPPAGYRFNDNRDGTTSMYHGTTGKLLVTFRNENRVSVACVC